MGRNSAFNGSDSEDNRRSRARSRTRSRSRSPRRRGGGRKAVDKRDLSCGTCDGQYYRMHHGTPLCRVHHAAVRKREEKMPPDYQKHARAKFFNSSPGDRTEVLTPWLSNGAMPLSQARELLKTEMEDSICHVMLTPLQQSTPPLSKLWRSL